MQSYTQFQTATHGVNLSFLFLGGLVFGTIGSMFFAAWPSVYLVLVTCIALMALFSFMLWRQSARKQAEVDGTLFYNGTPRQREIDGRYIFLPDRKRVVWSDIAAITLASLAVFNVLTGGEGILTVTCTALALFGYDIGQRIRNHAWEAYRREVREGRLLPSGEIVIHDMWGGEPPYIRHWAGDTYENLEITPQLKAILYDKQLAFYTGRYIPGSCAHKPMSA